MTTSEKTAKKYNKLISFHHDLKPVRMNLLRVSEANVAQRQLNIGWVDQIYENFDPDQMKRPHVSHREGYYWIIDGQHSVEALKKWLGKGWEDQNLPCEVYTGLTLTDEARLFRALNNTKAVNSFSKYKIGVTAESPTETEIEKSLALRGLVSSTSKEVPGAISCVATLVRVYERYGLPVLNRALKLTHEAWGDPGLEAAMIDGMGKVCNRYNGSLNEMQAIQSLGTVRGGVKGVLGMAEQLRLKTGGRKSDCVAASIVNIVNRDLTGKQRLPGWFK